MTISTLELYKPKLDWLTFTGRCHLDIVAAFNSWMSGMQEYYLGEKTTRWQQFRGEQFNYENGSAFAGQAVINHADWHGVTFSGELCGTAVPFFRPLVDNGIVECKRVDIQVTIQEPGDWEQIRFLNRMQRAGKRPEMRQSYDKVAGRNLMTVAVGSRTSEVYARVYEKSTDSGSVLLRMEGEYKGGKAVAVFQDLEGIDAGHMLKWHVQKLRDKKLELAFAGALEGYVPHKAKPIVRVHNKKREWLLGSVLPAFETYVNAHDSDGLVQAAFLEVLENAGII